MFLKGVLSKRQVREIERDTYLKEEYSKDYLDSWCYGNDLVDDFEIEGYSLSDDRIHSVSRGISMVYTK